MRKTLFRFDFGPRKVPQPENMHFHFHAFSGWGTSRGPKLNLKAFSSKVLNNYYFKIFGAFLFIFNKV